MVEGQGPGQPTPHMPQQKKGLSKGCVVALVVVGVIFVLAVIVGVTCYLKWDELVTTATDASLAEVKKMVAEDPPQGVDTTRFNAVADGFVRKLQEGDIKKEQYAPVLQTIGTATDDGKITGEEADLLMQQMISAFPSLGDVPAGQMSRPDTTGMAEDTTAAP